MSTKQVLKRMFATWDVFSLIDVLLVWFAIPIVIIFVIIGTFYWFFIKPFKSLRQQMVVNEIIACGLDEINGEAVMKELEEENAQVAQRQEASVSKAE